MRWAVVKTPHRIHIISIMSIIMMKMKKAVKLMEWLDDENDYSAFSAADKVIGRGAAFLYLLMGIKSIYVAVISQPSLDLLTENGVDLVYGVFVHAIRSRDNTGFCPIESAVTGIDNPQDALVRIRKRTAELAKG